MAPKSFFFGAMASSLQSSGMLTKEQMVYLFDRFDYLTSQSGNCVFFVKVFEFIFID